MSRLSEPVRSVVQDAEPLMADVMSDEEIARRYPLRSHEEHAGTACCRSSSPIRCTIATSCCATRSEACRAATERCCAAARACCPTRRRCASPAGCTGCSARSSQSATPPFTSSSRSRATPTTSPAPAACASWSRSGDGWRLLAVPSAFEIGLSDCRWIYRLDERTITVHAVAAGDDPAMQWRITVEGKPCRFLVFGHLVLGERELDHAGRIEIDAARKRFTFRPDPDSLWGQRYPRGRLSSGRQHARCDRGDRRR